MTSVKLGTRVVTAVGLVAALLGACATDGKPCYPQDYRACDCPGAPTNGYQQCTGDGQGYGACDCSGKLPGVPGSGDAGSADALGVEAASDASPDSALLPFMSVCDADAQCDTGLCYLFAAKGQRCTRHCTQPTECPPPSTGCNNMGLCKAP